MAWVKSGRPGGAPPLPYLGADTAMYVLLPDRGVSLSSALASLEGTGLAGVHRALQATRPQHVELGLPRIDGRFSADIVSTLRAMGMRRAFEPSQAEFSGVSDATTYLTRVQHTTRLKVDEKGTEAAAATVVQGAFNSASPISPPPSVVCDRPFLLALVDTTTGTMLFCGAVADPTR
jgi:serpin B